MSNDFDPYFKFLGIPPKEQPPHYYRLLGIELFEADPEVIAIAAQQCIKHVRSFQTGQYAIVSQKLQKKIAAAKACLLNPEKKREYDISLRLQLHLQPAQSPPLPPPLQEYLASPPVLQTAQTQPENTDFSINPIIILKETRDWLRNHKNVVSAAIKLGCIAVVVIIILMVSVYGKPLWNFTFDKSSDLVAKITGSSGEKPPELKPRMRSIPGVNPGNPANVARKQSKAVPSAAGVEGQSKTVPPPPDADAPVVAQPPENIREPPDTSSTTPSRTEPPSDISSMTLPSGKVFKFRLFKININAIIDLLKDSTKEDQVLFLDDPLGRICAFTEYKKGNFDGIFVAFNESRLPTIYATYADDNLDGIIKTWNEQGDRVYCCQYSKGVRDGFCCYFKDNFPRMLLDIDHNVVKGVFLYANGRLEKSFSSLEQASADKGAKTLLEELDSLESDLKSGEESFKKTARDESQLLRRERKAATIPQKKAVLLEHLEQHAAERQLLITSFWHYKGW